MFFLSFTFWVSENNRIIDEKKMKFSSIISIIIFNVSPFYLTGKRERSYFREYLLVADLFQV